MIVKKEYDFSNAEQGRFYHPLHELDIPVRLDKDVKKIILKTARKEHCGPNEIVNELLRKDLELVHTM